MSKGISSYKNPVIPGFYPDPSVCRVNEDYYLVTSSFEYFPGVPIFHSKDLVNWQQIGHCLTRESQIPLHGVEASGGIWAPTIRYHDGTFYMITTNLNGKGNFFVTATDPAGDWSEPVWLAGGGIDPSLAFIDGTVYYTVSHPDSDGDWGIAQAKIDIKTGEFLTELKHIWYGSGGKSPEAPHLYKIDDFFYLMIAEGGTFFTHMVTIARSSSPWGPFESCSRNPILTNIHSRDLSVHGVGHGDLVEDHLGNWWMIHHGFQIAQKYMSHIGRETFLSPVKWEDDGWPVVNDGKCVTRESTASLLPSVPVQEEIYSEAFTEGKLPLHWNYLRNPNLENYEFSRDGHLILWGSHLEIHDKESPTLLARRQRYYECTIRATFEFDPTNENEEAGLIIFITGEFYYKVVKKILNDKYVIVLEKRADDFHQIVATIEISNEPISITVRANRLTYDFYYSLGYCLNEIPIGSASTRFLANEVVGRGFTGAYVGMYASGKGKKSIAPARFKHFVLFKKERFNHN